jgi:hypothetical protein
LTSPGRNGRQMLDEPAVGMDARCLTGPRRLEKIKIPKI